MDYEEEEQYEEMQAEVIEIDTEDTPYLDLRDDRERQGYAILKNRSFVHTRAFDPEYGSRLLTIQFLCTLREVENGVYF